MQPQQHPPQQSIQQQTSNRVQKELSIVSIWKIYITKLPSLRRNVPNF